MRLPQLASADEVVGWARRIVQQIETEHRPLSRGSGVLGSGTQTTVSNPGCRATSVVVPVANDATSAAAALYVTATADGYFILAHGAGSGGAFSYVIL